MAILINNILAPRTQAARRRPPFHRWLMVLIAAVATAGASQQPSLEYQVKASYIYNLIQFIDWPQAADTPQIGDFTICVFGANRFGVTLDQLQGKKVKGRLIAVRYPRRIEDTAACQVVFISSSQRWRQGEVIAAVSGSGVLTIGEMPGFIEDGGIINFIKIGDKIRFEINNSAARRAQLSISAQLLNLASRR